MAFEPLKKVFAENGDFTNPPEAASTTVANQDTGFPVLQSTPLASGGLPVSRSEMNGVFNFYSGHILNYTLGNVYDADVANSSYSAYRSVVRDVLNGTPYTFIAKVDNPSNNPVISGTTINDSEWELYGMGLLDTSTNGYALLPGGLIIQWGSGDFGGGTITLPITFPNAILGAAAVDNAAASNIQGIEIASSTTSAIAVTTDAAGGDIANYIVIGY